MCVILYVCIYMCIYICVCVYIYIYIYQLPEVYIDTYTTYKDTTYTNTHTYICVCISVCIYVYCGGFGQVMEYIKKIEVKVLCSFL